ncbi:hypothetical protein PM082_019754 [Marasmius tenuissimus]|nr:hypothetical protein PM082_019754 [Marasmius tenuissimus]
MGTQRNWMDLALQLLSQHTRQPPYSWIYLWTVHWPTREKKTIVMKPTRKNLWKKHTASEDNILECREPKSKQFSPVFLSSSTSVSYTATKRAKKSQGTTRVKIDAHDETSARPTRPPAQGKAAAISNSQTQPKRAAQKSLGTKTTGADAGQTSTPARRTQTAGRVVTTPSKPKKQPEPEDREVTPVKPSPAPARTMGTQTTHPNATVKKAWR